MRVVLRRQMQTASEAGPRPLNGARAAFCVVGAVVVRQHELYVDIVNMRAYYEEQTF